MEEVREELKPCPFCGEIPKMIKQYGRYLLIHKCRAVTSNLGWLKKDDVFKGWNTRYEAKK